MKIHPLKKLSTVLSIILVALLFGCNTTRPALDIALKDMEVIPITTPTVYRYGPSVGTLFFSVKSQLDGKKTSFNAPLKYSVIEDSQRLIWHIFMDKWKENGKSYSTRLPFVDITMDTDFRGKIGTAEINFPALTAMGKSIPPQAKKDLSTLKKQLTSLSQPLPERGVVSGQVFISQALPLTPPGFSTDKQQLQSFLDGEFVHNGKNYVSISINDSIQFKDDKTGMQMFFDIKGHGILSRENMETIESVLELTIEDAMGTEHGSIQVKAYKMAED
ncbi:MAG: hypothetical protein OCC46_10285 [Pseudodesulfovibrio sp.]